MPRDSGGLYTLVSGNPVVSGTIIASTWANTTMDDVATALTDSLSRTGNGAMQAPLKHTDGSESNPSQTFNSDPLTGRYLAATSDMRDTVNAQDVTRYTAAGMEVWIDGAWHLVTPKTWGVGRKNLIINGGFDIWQRGDVITYAPSEANSYNSDRWFAVANTGGGTVTKSTRNIAGVGAIFTAVYSEIGVSIGPRQRIEIPTHMKAGPQTLSFYAGTASNTIRVLIRGNVGGNLFSDTAVPCSFTEKSVVTYEMTEAFLTTASLTYLEVIIMSASSEAVEVGQVQLEQGSAATEFEYRPIAEELALCQRYYEKSYRQVDVAGQATSNSSFNFVHGAGQTGPVGQYTNEFAVLKAGLPTVSLYSDAGNIGFVTLLNLSGSFVAEQGATATQIGEGRFRIVATQNASSGLRFHWVADAEL